MCSISPIRVRTLWRLFRRANCGVITATQIFSFRDGDLDERENLQEHGIKIVRVEESGDIDFVVYGYMNRDVHEGEVGIAVYHYGAELNQVEEELFIPMKSSYEYLKEDMKLLKKEWLPKLIMTSPDEFDAAWDHYVDMYNSTINVKAYEKQLDIEIQNRMKNRIK